MLPLLQGSVEPSSVRLEAQGAEVLRVETSYVDASDLPMDEAQRLLLGLEKLAAGESMEQLLEAHPRLTRPAILAALNFAAGTLRADVLYPLGSRSA